MSPSRQFGLVLLALVAFPSLTGAQIANDIRVRHRAGQTFVTWREIPAPDKRYRVYRSERPLVDAQDLKDADLLGEVDDRTSRNQGRSLASGTEWTWVIEDGGAPLAADDGLFVYTCEAESTRAWYAVTSVQAGGENRTLVPGKNATSRYVWERAAAPRPVLQSDANGVQLYGHWVSDRATPFQPALSPWPSRGFDFLFEPGSAPGPHGLVLRLHSAGQTYAQGWPQRFETPQDVDILAPSDLMPYTSWSFWFGAQERLPNAPASSTRVWNFTQQRLLWTLDWIVGRLGAAHDPERVYVIGGSMGAIGGMYLVGETPARFAAALLRNGLYDLEATDYRNPAGIERVFGSFDLDLPTTDGIPIVERANASYMANRDLGEDWPVIRTISGRNDETVGWMSAVELYAGLARAGRPAWHYFDERTHEPNGYWKDLERNLLARTFATRRDRPSLRFGDCTMDDDAGDGSRTDGDAVGTINGYVEYDMHTAQATERALDFEVYLRAAGALDDAPGTHALATLRPARTGPFAPLAGEAVHYTLREGGRLVDEHLLFADEHGRVVTPPAPLAVPRRDCRFERDTPATRAPLFVGGAPTAGEAMQVVLRGTPGEAWALFLTLPGSFPGPVAVLRGQLDEHGLADLAVPLPRLAQAGLQVGAFARIGRSLTAEVVVTVQADARRPSDRVRRR